MAFAYNYQTGSYHYNSHLIGKLSNELEIVKTYMEVEKVRFDERLNYQVIFQDEKLGNCQIPRFLIQPIVENAIKHGISKLAGKGVVKICISEENNNLIIKIHDNGVPFPDDIFRVTG